MLTIYNNLTRKKEQFKPINGNKVGMYICGVTTYDFCHIGHGRTYVAFDVIARYLQFRGYELNHIRNITDIDDKIINRAIENSEHLIISLNDSLKKCIRISQIWGSCHLIMNLVQQDILLKSSSLSRPNKVYRIDDFGLQPVNNYLARSPRKT